MMMEQRTRMGNRGTGLIGISTDWSFQTTQVCNVCGGSMHLADYVWLIHLTDLKKNINNQMYIAGLVQRRRQDFGSGGGEHFRGSASYGVRWRSPPDAGEFSKIFKKFLKKIANNSLF